MSEYVESRYAKFVLGEARLAEEKVASKLLTELVRDLGRPHGLSAAGEQAVTSIRLLALRLDHPQFLPVREWDAADQAADAWCRNAHH